MDFYRLEIRQIHCVRKGFGASFPSFPEDWPPPQSKPMDRGLKSLLRLVFTAEVDHLTGNAFEQAWNVQTKGPT